MVYSVVWLNAYMIHLYDVSVKLDACSFCCFNFFLMKLVYNYIKG